MRVYDRGTEPDLGLLLDIGPFAAALRAAVRRRGLTLDRLRAHLARRGQAVALSSLSDWQHGRRRPRSMGTVGALEQILGLPAGSLLRLLTDPAPDPRLGRGRPEHATALAELQSQLPGVREHPVDVVSTHEKITIDERRRCASIWSRTVVRARRDGVDRYLIRYYGDPDCVIDRVELGALENCRTGRVLRHSAGVIVAELLFDQALRPGETWVFEARWRDRTGGASTEHAHLCRYAGEQYLMEVRFDAGAVPLACHAFVQSGLSSDRCATTALPVNRHHAVHLLAAAERPGLRGIAWDWSD
jgi:hypothetical protein